MNPSIVALRNALRNATIASVNAEETWNTYAFTHGATEPSTWNDLKQQVFETRRQVDELRSRYFAAKQHAVTEDLVEK